MPAAVRVLALAGLFATLAPLFGGTTSAQEPATARRLALVIGEAAYQQERLPTADADAGLMAVSLAQAGFDVTALVDADAVLLRRTVAEFAAKARAAGPGVALVVYVSGYGLQLAGDNWLVPVGAKIDSDGDVSAAALRLAEISGPLEQVAAATRLFLFDLARETPFARKGPPLAAGLALADAPVGSFYAYNTAPGAVAPAATPPYGAYVRAFAEAMQVPGATIGEILRRVRLRVGERTDGAAVPFDDGSGDPGFSFFSGKPSPAAALPAVAGLSPAVAYSTAVARDTLPGYNEFVAAFPHDPLAGRVRAMAAARREALIWSEAVRANTPRAYWTYMRRYPRGPHFDDVRRQLFALHAMLEPPPRFDIVPFEGLSPPPPEEVAILEHLTFADADGPPIPAPPDTLLPPPRGAFFDSLPPPPLAPVGSLPLPLPVASLDGQGRPSGPIGEPAVAGGALGATLTSGRDGFVMTTAKGDGTILSQLASTVGRGVRVLAQTVEGATISRVTIATASDGATTMTQVGPGDRLLSRSVSRDASAGARATTLFDAGAQAVAVTIVSASGIAKADAAIPGRTLPPSLVFVVTRDPKGGPAIILEQAEAPRVASGATPTPEKPVPEASRTKPATTDSTGVAAAGGGIPQAGPTRTDANPDASTKAAKAEPKAASVLVDAGAPKPPALPTAAGLTGQAPALNIPPPPPAPAFDAAAKPVVATTPPPEPPGGASAIPPAVAPAPLPIMPPAVTPPAAAQAPVAARPPQPTVTPQPAPAASQKAPDVAHLPSDPPLPPRRARDLDARAKPRAGR